MASGARPETFPMWNLMNFAEPTVAARWRYEGCCLSEVAEDRGTDLARLHRARLGPSYLTYGLRRYYTWDGPGWRVFVANSYGMKFELAGREPGDDPGSSEARRKMEDRVKAALAMWQSYLDAIGVPRTELDPKADRWMAAWANTFQRA